MKVFKVLAIVAIVLYFFTAWYIGKYTHGNVLVFMLIVGLMVIGKLVFVYACISDPRKEEDPELIAKAYRDLERVRLKKAIQEYELLINPKTN
jgi:hypothetical protein